MPYKSQIHISEKQIQKIIQEYFPDEKLKKLAEIKDSFVNPIFEFELSNNNSFILKINNPEWPQKQTRELKAITLAKKKTTMPLHHIIAHYEKDDKYPYSFLIFEKLPGMDLKDLAKQNLVTKKEFLSIVRKVGFHLGELHSINFDFYGDFCIKRDQNSKKLDSNMWGNQFSNWTDCFKAFCFGLLNWVDRTSFPNYRKPLEWKSIQLSESIEEPNEKGCFVHSDIHPSNILVKNGQITGIIDFEWSYAGSPSLDFLLTKAGFSFSDFPSLEESKILSQLDLDQEEIGIELLTGYQTSYKHPLANLSDDLIYFVWLLYMIGSWGWVIQSKTLEEVNEYEKGIHDLFSQVVSQ
ncbi:MAG: phosphotransferase [Asgard group archaeon]|nr:phosphotransferase [Asgard group archaeon]